MDVSRSGYYKWLSRKINPSSKERRIKEDSEFIIGVYKKHSSHGYRWLTRYIENRYHIRYSEKYVFKILQYNFLRSTGKHYQWRKPEEESLTYKNLIWNGWRNIDGPLQVIVSDMTSFYIKGIYYELTLYIDAFNNEILSYGLSYKKGDISSYYDGLNQLMGRIEKEQTSTIILHTDQGAIYSSKSYNELLSNNSIQHSMSRKGTPTDNPKNESLNGWIKEELFIDFGLRKSDDVSRCIKEYIHYYNYIRPAYALNYKTPVQYKIDMGFEHYYEV